MGGLKGGLAIAIVLSIPADFPGRDLLLNLTLGVVLFTLLVKAPTIRPLMVRLGMDRLTDEEKSELEHTTNSALLAAHQGIQEFREASLLSGDCYRRATDVIDRTFAVETGEDEPPSRRHEDYLNAIRIENEVAQRLFEGGVISQYTYLDLRNLLQRDRDRQTADVPLAPQTTRENPFMRLEMAILGRLREHDWAAGLLARYQRTRLTQHLQRDIAGILMCQAVLAMLDEPGTETGDIYRERMARRQQRLGAVRDEFPELYRSFEYQLATGMALSRARRNSQLELHHGEIGAKAFANIDARIDASLSELEQQSTLSTDVAVPDLLEQVPLLQGLSAECIRAIAAHAHPVTFLTGDVVIGEGQKGDALYIISRGRVGVTRQAGNGEETTLGELNDGDFFGETGLLGDHVRTATVKALTPSTLLRLTRRDIIALSERNPEVSARLAQARTDRET